MRFDRKITLKNELTDDPLGRGYAGMTDQQAATDLNTAYCEVTRERVETWEVIEATVASEWAALTANEKERYSTFIAAGVLNPSGANTKSAFAAMFGAGTQTRANLLALSVETISRADELEIGFVTAERVASARAM